MPDRITKLQRWIDLIAFLVSRRLPVPFEDLVRGVPGYGQKWEDGDETTRATVRRMFERDKDELRKHGIPIQTVPYTINFGNEQIEGYRLTRRDFYLPYLKLVGEVGRAENPDKPERGRPPRPVVRDPHRIGEVEISRDDAALALSALRRVADVPSFPYVSAARSAFRKLAFDLDPDVFGQSAPVLFVERPETGELLDRLRVLSEALLAKKRVMFRYHGIYRGEQTSREVEPYGLLFHHGHWYLVANDRERAALRVFRAERMEDVTANRRTPNTPDYSVPDTFRIEEYAGREAWELGAEDEPAVQASVLFRWPVSLVAERNRQGVLVETRQDGSAVRAFEVHQVNPFLRFVLSYQGEAAVVDPPELARALRELARDVAAAYATERSGENGDG